MRKRIPASGAARPYLTLAFSQLAVGAAAIFARFALTGAQPIAVSAGRLAVAALVLIALACIRPQGFRALDWRARWTFSAAGMALAVHFAAWIWSLEYTTVAISTLLVATTPIWTALYDAAFGSARLSWTARAAFVPAAIGIVLVAGFRSERVPIGGHQAAGMLLAAAGAVAIAIYFLLIRRVAGQFDTRQIVTNTYSIAAAVLVLAAAIARQPPPAAADTRAWTGLLAMALISQLLGHTGMNAALRWFGASSVAFSTLVEPVVAAALAFAIFGEALSARALAGAVLVLVSVAIFLREQPANRLVPQG